MAPEDLRLALGKHRAWALDVLLALGCEALLLNRAFVGIGTPRDIAGSAVWTIPLLSLVPASLLVRRQLPVVTVGLTTSVPALHAVLTGTGAAGAFLLLPICIAVYSLGVYGSTRAVVGGLVAAVVAESVTTMVDPAVVDTDAERWAWAFWLCFQVAVAVLGIFVAARRRERSERSRAAAAQRHAIEEAQAAVLAERARIARELHDVVTHNLNVVVLHADAARGFVRDDPVRVARSLTAIESSGRAALVEMRRLLGMLRDAELDGSLPLAPQPRLDRVGDLVAHARGAGVDVDVDVRVEAEISEGVQLAAYRIVQESLSNVMKHAPGSHVTVALVHDAGSLVVEVANDGSGAALVPSVSAGHGLPGMRERVGVFAGQLSAGPADDGGFVVRAVLPAGDRS